MDFSKKALRNLIVYLALLISVVVFDHVSTLHQLWQPFGRATPLLLNAMYLHWMFSARRRFPQKQMRKNITLFVAAFLVLSLIRVAKYNYTPFNADVQRWLWYAYYIPLVFGSLFMFYASLYIGKPDDYKRSKAWYLLFLPSALLAAAVMTNDLHQAAFRFGSGIDLWNDDYAHGFVYVLAVAWMLLMVLGVTVMAVRSTVSRRLFKTAWLPLAVLALAGLYWAQYAFIGHTYGPMQYFLELPDFICLFSIALWESFIIARIVVSNKDYPAIFAASSLGAGLADGAFAVRQIAAEGLRPTPQELLRAVNGDLLLPDGDTLLKVRSVPGGWFYWTENLAELRCLREKLDDTADYLTEENAMMRMASEIEAGRKITAEQTRLYNRVTAALRPQLDRLNTLLQTLPQDEAAFRRALQTVGVLLAYAKRRSFLLLTANESPLLRGDELGLCFEESVKALRMAEIPCELMTDSAFLLPAESADALYAAFAQAIERSLASLKSVQVSLRPDGADRVILDVMLKTDVLPLTQQELDAYTATFFAARMEHDGERVHFVFAVNAGTTTGGAADDADVD